MRVAFVLDILSKQWSSTVLDFILNLIDSDPVNLSVKFLNN